MGGIGIALEAVLLGLLGFTLLHAIRLQRALGHLRHDRASLHDAVSDLDTGTRQAESGIARLREAANQLGGNLGQAAALRDDLAYLAERGEVLADRLESLVRTARAIDADRPPADRAPIAPSQSAALPAEPAFRASAHAPYLPPPRSQAERNLLAVLQGRR